MKHLLNYILLLLLTSDIAGQQAKLLKNINPGTSGSFVFGADVATFEYKDRLYFVANNVEFGTELWVYDGDKTELFKDINPGAKSSDVDFMFKVGDKLMFAADNGVNGYEWWVSDGTPDNTKLLVDLLPGTGDGLSKCCYGYSTRSFHVFKNELYFNGFIPGNQSRFFKTNGTAAGTVELAKLNSSQRYAEGFLEWKGNLYFEVDSEGLWKTDGTPAGTIQIKSTVAGTGTEEFEPQYLTDMGDYILMKDGYDHDIWKSDGTLAGTTLIKKMFYPQTQNNVGHYFFRFGNEAFFPATNPIDNTEMWKTNGTLAGTVQVSEIEVNPTFTAYYPKRRVAFKNKIYYLGGKSELGSQIYILDPANGNTNLLVDFKAKINGDVYFQTDLIANTKHIFFVAGNAFNRELWYSDGTAAGTYEIKISPNGESTPERLTFYKDKLFFFAANKDFDFEPHIVELSSLITNTQDFETNHTFCYPNPTNDQLFIDLEFTPKQVEIYDVTGRLEATFYDTDALDLSNIVAGLKIIKVVGGDEKLYSSRFMKL
jgi:trimeric autotransporter adhesin